MAEAAKVSLSEVAAGLDEFWSQRVVGEVNGTLLKVAKGINSTEWHAHEDQEEVIVVTGGSLIVRTRSGDVTLAPGEMIIIPRGVEHCPVAEEEVHLLLIGRDVTSNAVGGKPEWSYQKAAALTSRRPAHVNQARGGNHQK